MLLKLNQKLLFLLIGVFTLGIITFFPSFSVSAHLCDYHEDAYYGLNLSKLTAELENTGLLGEVHGAVNSSGLYVLSVREPDNFFNFRHFSLIPANEDSHKTLAQMKRHDQVCIQGELKENPSPQPHILVKSAKFIDSWSGLDSYGNYTYEATLPEDLQQQTTLVGKVHAIAYDGQILVVEYKDGILPIFVHNQELTEDLYRGDLIRLSYKIQSSPEKPTHLQLDPQVKSSVEVIDRLVDQQDKYVTLTGNLVKFPKSPQLKFDVYGLAVVTQGITRYFTLVNFEDSEKFAEIRNKLADIWNKNPNNFAKGRNLLINRDITLSVQGKINITSPEQANPQLLLENAGQIQEYPLKSS